MWLLLGLEFELAADIIRSVISPTWKDIGELGAIAVIRTFLNYFLEKDLEEGFAHRLRFERLTTQQAIVLALQASILMTVFEFGLRATPGDVLYIVRRPALLGRSLIAMFGSGRHRSRDGQGLCAQSGGRDRVVALATRRFRRSCPGGKRRRAGTSRMRSTAGESAGRRPVSGAAEKTLTAAVSGERSA